jgi:tRNA-splicing ligase RtcB (3'-phosphate/5'-hydroxy nucleic acid ligase)
MNKENLTKINEFLWEIPKQGKMNVPARIYASEQMLDSIFQDQAPQQAMNVACLPGIINYSFAMPDIHWGYGFPIGGVAGFNIDNGIVSPGGVGYDINCGVRLLKTNLKIDDIKKRLTPLVKELYKNIPSGVGSKGSIKLSSQEEKKVLTMGAAWAIQNGYGFEKDLDKIEENGTLENADPDLISDHALQRGRAQLGTLGSGNHFVEIGAVREVFDEQTAKVLGLEKDQVTLIIHTGSRGFGHQVCEDYIKIMQRASSKYGIDLPDRQLCCAPIQSEEGQNYLTAMKCAVNFSFGNRQMITHWAREAFQNVLGSFVQMDVVYEVAHNIAKIEEHIINGKKQKICVHRKGATRAFGPHHPQIPEDYHSIGQPVLIPGDMGRYSYVLVGTQNAMHETYGSTCHGAGRKMSRRQAKKSAHGRSIEKELLAKGIVSMASSRATMSEEISEAYKDVSEVVDIVHSAGISSKVVKLIPLGVIKG